MPVLKQDLQFMRRALALAAKGLGRVAPNPMVGCVIVRGGHVIAEGWHKRFGGAHAEIEALKKLKRATARGATMYVTLEPCHHFGKTPPCVDAVIAFGIKRIVIAMRDPNPLTRGKSIRKMRAAGIAVSVGICGREAGELNRFFIKHVTTGVPYVIVKVAQSHDGKIAAAPGMRTQITGLAASRYVQNLRRSVTAIMVGRGTVRIDDPLLNVRRKKMPQPIRVVLDTQLRINSQAEIFRSPGGRVILVCGPNSSPRRVRELEVAGATVLSVALQKGRVDLRSALKKMGAIGISSVLVEGGAAVFTSFARAHLADEWHVITAPHDIGKGGLAAFSLKSAPNLGRVSRRELLGQDTLIVLKYAMVS